MIVKYKIPFRNSSAKIIDIIKANKSFIIPYHPQTAAAGEIHKNNKGGENLVFSETKNKPR